MRAYTELLVQTCHRRGAHAIGGMAAFIPSPPRPGGERGRDGPGPRRQGARVARRLRRDLGGPSGPRPAGDRDLRRCPRSRRRTRRAAARPEVVGHRRRSCSTWPCPAARSPRPGSGRTCRSRCSTSTRGCGAIGAAAINNLMEDAATAEICRSQLWQWRTTRTSRWPMAASFDGEPLQDDPRRGARPARRHSGGPTGRGGHVPRSARARRRLRRVPDPAGVRVAGLAARISKRPFAADVTREHQAVDERAGPAGWTRPGRAMHVDCINR